MKTIDSSDIQRAIGCVIYHDHAVRNYLGFPSNAGHRSQALKKALFLEPHIGGILNTLQEDALYSGCATMLASYGRSKGGHQNKWNRIRLKIEDARAARRINLHDFFVLFHERIFGDELSAVIPARNLSEEKALELLFEKFADKPHKIPRNMAFARITVTGKRNVEIRTMLVAEFTE